MCVCVKRCGESAGGKRASPLTWSAMVVNKSLLFMEQGERLAFRSSAPAEDPASHSQRRTGSEKQRARSSNRALVVPAPARGKLG